MQNSINLLGNKPFHIWFILNDLNLLVLKTADSKFVINGNYTVSPSAKYDASGTSFEYHRLEGNSLENNKFKRDDGVTEWMTSLGPLLEPIHLMVILK